MILELEGAGAGERARVIGNPVKMRDSGRTRHAYPPELGGDTRAVLKDVLGYDDAKRAALKTAGAFSLPPKKAG